MITHPRAVALCPATSQQGDESAADACIGVQTREVHVHNGEVEDHAQVAHNGQPSGTGAGPALGGAGVQIAGVNHPDDKGPDFLGAEDSTAIETWMISQ